MNKNISTSKTRRKSTKKQITNNLDKAMSLFYLGMKIKLEKIKIQVDKPGGLL